MTSELGGGEWSTSRTGRFTPEEGALGTHWLGGWMGPSAGLDGMEKRKFLTLSGLELRPLGCPGRSQSLYRLSYPGSYVMLNKFTILLPYFVINQVYVRSSSPPI
jgi:hypothetical protein